MAEHTVEVELPTKVVLNKDVRITIRVNGEKLGRLDISKGTIDWRPANKKTPISLTWEQFARLIESS